MTLSPEATEVAISTGVVARICTHDVVRLVGPDALSYLQGQCSQDIAALALGESTEALLLSPQGKFEAYVRVLLAAPQDLWIDTPSGTGSVVYDRLKRFKLRVKAELSATSLETLELRGPKAAELRAGFGNDAHVLVVDWPGFVGIDVLGVSSVPDGVEIGDEETFEAARISAGWPLPGRDLTEKTIPQEAGIVERAVSFTKGCYTGQELVARLDARGNNVARRLRLIRLESARGLGAGDEVFLGDKAVGTVTSLAARASGGAVALAYLRRDVEVPATVAVSGVSGEALALPANALSENR
jgi:folate-binding protein YgfZ